MYNVSIENKKHEQLCLKTFDTQWKAIDFVQDINNVDDRACYFTIIEISADENGNIITKKILNNATYIGNTGENE